ncbi:MAG TPA: MFS transporter [Saprospiraceae bacterium]|nr:MFS transporter [Saprospiraceae bacterium]HMP12915.1 MFS transporter [Saprospiraceae bacterium]
MTTSSGKTRSPLLIIFLTVFIDLLGIGVIIPVIPALFFEPTSSFFPASVNTEQRSILYGLLIAAYPMLQFFGAPMLGALSDRYGRKPILSLSLLGTMLGYLLFAWAILNQNIWLLFISRALPGFTGGNIAIILSSISDVSDAQSKAKNFGLVGMAFGLGFILGPTIGGILADKSVVSWFNAATPFWFTAALTLLNVLLVQVRFRETLQQRRLSPINLFTGFSNIGRAFRMPNLRAIFMVILLLSLGFTFFTQFFSVLLIQKFSFTEKNIGLLFGWIGIWLALTQGVLVRILSRRFASANVIAVSMLLLSIALAMLLLPDQSFWFYLLNPLVAIAQGTTAPNLTAVVSEQANADQQGEILGINQSMQSLGQIIPPLIAGYLNTIDGRLPIATAAVLTLSGWLVYVLVFRRR